MDEKSKTIWKKVTATVNPLGGPRSPRPRVVPDETEPTIIDLHGLTTHEAYLRVRSFLYRHGNKLKTTRVTVITGKSGDIRREFPDWLCAISTVKSYEEQNGGGAFEIRLRPSE